MLVHIVYFLLRSEFSFGKWDKERVPLFYGPVENEQISDDEVIYRLSKTHPINWWQKFKDGKLIIL